MTRKKNEIETTGVIYRLDDKDEMTVVHKNHKMNSNKVYEYNGTKYKLTAYLGGKSITKEIERLLGKKDNFMLINMKTYFWGDSYKKILSSLICKSSIETNLLLYELPTF